MADMWSPVTVKAAPQVETQWYNNPMVVQLLLSVLLIGAAYLLHRLLAGTGIRPRLPRAELPILEDKSKRKMFRAHGKDQLTCTVCPFSMKDPQDRVEIRRK